MSEIRINQVELVTAIFDEIARQQPDAGILTRHMNAIVDAADSIVRALSIGERMSTPGEGIEAWRRTDQVGLSSDYMACILSGRGRRDYAHPHDPADFGRCITLLEAAPELRENLPKMAECSAVWAGLIAEWRELEALYQEELPSGMAPKLYKKMRGIIETAEAVSDE